jgi:hypothetical protein
MSGLSILSLIFWLHFQKMGDSYTVSSGHSEWILEDNCDSITALLSSVPVSFNCLGTISTTISSNQSMTFTATAAITGIFAMTLCQCR